MEEKEFKVGDLIEFDLTLARKRFTSAHSARDCMNSGTTMYGGHIIDAIANGEKPELLVTRAGNSSEVISIRATYGAYTTTFSAYASMFKSTGKSKAPRKVKVGEVVQLTTHASYEAAVVLAVYPDDGSFDVSAPLRFENGIYWSPSSSRMGYRSITCDPFSVKKVFRSQDTPEIGDVLLLKNGLTMHVQGISDNGALLPFGELYSNTGASLDVAYVYFNSPSAYKVVANDVRLRRAPGERQLLANRYRAGVNANNSIYDLRRHGLDGNDELFKKVGKTVAAVINKSGDIHEHLEVLNSEATRMAWDFKLRVRMALNKASEYAVILCEHCARFETADNARAVQVTSSGSTEAWCPACYESEGECYYSEDMGLYIADSIAVRFYRTMHQYEFNDPEWITRVHGSSNEYVYSDGDFYAYDVAEELGIYDDDDDDSDELIRGYHDSTRNWKPRGDSPQFPCLGVELEVYAPQRKRSAQAVRDIFFTSEVYLEHDSSLSSTHGFEIISHPWGKQIWETKAPKLLDALTRTKTVAYNHPDTDKNYGIHVNIARDKLSPLQEVRIFMFFADRKNINFVRAMAQREQIYHADVDMGTLEDPSRLWDSGESHVGKGKYRGMGKYCPINMKESVFEFRIFQSTLALNSFMKNLELIWALYDWTRHPTGISWNHIDFVKWLCSRPQVEQDFPNLMAYLRKPQYRIKRGKGSIANTWIEHVRPAVRSSIVIEQDEEQLQAA